MECRDQSTSRFRGLDAAAHDSEYVAISTPPVAQD